VKDEEVMTDLGTRRASNATKSKDRRKAATKSPLRVLAVIDGSESSGRVTKYLLDLHARDGALDVVLLNVQPAPVVGRLRGYGSFRRGQIEDRLINDLGKRIVASAARHLDAASIAHKDRIELGDPPDTIVRCAEEEKCNLIVLAESRPNAVHRWLMRTTGAVISSVASVVIHLARMPVLVAGYKVNGESWLTQSGPTAVKEIA
jgi:nucleotide-binding universal stress UspA family protein